MWKDHPSLDQDEMRTVISNNIARSPKIVVVKEDFGAAQVAEESVGEVVKAANIMNAVETMATDFMPDEKSVLHNDELGLVFTELTDASAT